MIFNTCNYYFCMTFHQRCGLGSTDISFTEVTVMNYVEHGKKISTTVPNITKQKNCKMLYVYIILKICPEFMAQYSMLYVTSLFMFSGSHYPT